ncbi:MAG: hypothetical protein AAGU27_13455 [Dehalobacterium sp.]
MGCCRRRVAPIAPIAPIVTTERCNPFRSIVGLIVVLIVIEFLCCIFNWGGPGVADVDL